MNLAHFVTAFKNLLLYSTESQCVPAIALVTNPFITGLLVFLSRNNITLSGTVKENKCLSILRLLMLSTKYIVTFFIL